MVARRKISAVGSRVLCGPRVAGMMGVEMRRTVRLAAAAAVTVTLLLPAAVAATPPTPTMTATACRLDASTVRVGVSWSSLPVTGGEIFINNAPLESKYEVAWNQKGRHGTHVEDMFVDGDIADVVTVNLYNDKIPGWFEQRVIGEGNDAEEILPC